MGDEPRLPRKFEGWPDAFAALLFGRVSAFLRNRDPDLAQEAVQETMTKAIERQREDPSFRFPNAQALRSWLSQTAVGWVKNELARRNRNRPYPPEPPEPPTSSGEENAQALRECIQELPEDEQRQLVKLKEEDKTDQEISIAWYGGDEDRFRQRVRRLWEKVRELLRQCLVRKGIQPWLRR